MQIILFFLNPCSFQKIPTKLPLWFKRSTCYQSLILLVWRLKSMLKYISISFLLYFQKFHDHSVSLAMCFLYIYSHAECIIAYYTQIIF